MTEDTFCAYCMVIANKCSERGKAKLSGREDEFIKFDNTLKRMIERFKKELRDELK